MVIMLNFCDEKVTFIVKKCWKNIGKNRNGNKVIISLKCLFESSFCECEIRRSQRHIQNPVEFLR